MDFGKFELQAELQSAKTLRELYEKRLNSIGINLSDLPEDVCSLLTECVEIQKATKVSVLEYDFLKTFYMLKKQQVLENNIHKANLRTEIQKQEEEIAKETAECEILENFIKTTEKRGPCDSEMQENKLSIEANKERLQKVLDSFEDAKDVNIDQLVARSLKLAPKEE